MIDCASRKYINENDSTTVVEIYNFQVTFGYFWSLLGYFWVTFGHFRITFGFLLDNHRTNRHQNVPKSAFFSEFVLKYTKN